MKKVSGKVTASTLSAALVTYVLSRLSEAYGFSLPDELTAVVIGLVTAALTFAAGYLARHHIMSDEWADEFTSVDEADRLAHESHATVPHEAPEDVPETGPGPQEDADEPGPMDARTVLATVNKLNA